MISYLKPGGRLVAQMSGTFSAFGLLNQVLPQSVSMWALRKATRRAPESIFPAYYHHCWATRLEQMVASCSKHEADRYIWERITSRSSVRWLAATSRTRTGRCAGLIGTLGLTTC